MGMYTEIYCAFDLKEEAPEDVVGILKSMTSEEVEPITKPQFCESGRWRWLFCDGSFYHDGAKGSFMNFNEISDQWKFMGRGDIKNYQSEIEGFFKWIAPYLETQGFIGFYRYEESPLPTIVWNNHGKIMEINPSLTPAETGVFHSKGFMNAQKKDDRCQ